jgi:formiminotetrahydrofolate cyclodeaminase
MRRVVDAARILERHLHVAARDDAHAWDAVVQARRAPAGNPAALADRIRSVDAALMGASEVPLRIARLAADVVSLAAETADAGDHVTAPDAWAGATIAHAAVQAALGLLHGNLAMLADSTLATAPRAEARDLLARAAALLDQARHAVRHIAG